MHFVHDLNKLSEKLTLIKFKIVYFKVKLPSSLNLKVIKVIKALLKMIPFKYIHPGLRIFFVLTSFFFYINL